MRVQHFTLALKGEKGLKINDFQAFSYAPTPIKFFGFGFNKTERAGNCAESYQRRGLNVYGQQGINHVAKKLFYRIGTVTIKEVP